MKNIKILILLSALAMLFASCVKEVAQNPYTRNTGEEYITLSLDSLGFPGRGAKLTFTVSCSYDSRIVAPEWVTLASTEIPGDCREFTVSATAEPNSEKGGTDRTGEIIISSKTMSKTILLTQPYYERPECPFIIADEKDFLAFVQAGSFYEVGEVVEMTSDINLDGVEFNENIPVFKGILNANGFKISNWTTSLALIVKNQGAVNDLSIDASCKLSLNASEAETRFAPIAEQNYGYIGNCVNNAAIDITGQHAYKMYVGGIAGYNYNGGEINACVNRGEIRFSAAGSSANVYLGGITGCSVGNIINCEIYGPITCNPTAFSSVYYIGGITAKQETGDMTGNIVHKEAKIYTNDKSSSSKSYIGGIVGFVEGAPKTGNNQVYSDIEVNLKVESNIGSLQGWQAKVDKADMPNATLFEGSIVNSNITAYTKGKGANGNNPCNSAGFVTGRFSGQSGKATTLHYGTAEQPIKVSGSIYCLQTQTKKVATAKDYQAMLDGDGSKTSVNAGAIPETDYGNILYEVRGDGQTGDPEDMVVKTDAVKLSVAAEGGQASFTVRGNYEMQITSNVDWITPDVDKVEGDGAYHDIVLTVLENDKTLERTGTVSVAMPMGTTETVTVIQAGNQNVPASIVVDLDSLALDPAGQTAVKFNVTANYTTSIECSEAWVTCTPESVIGDMEQHSVSVLAEKNKSGALRSATITLTCKDIVKIVKVSQEKFVVPAYTQIKNADEFIEFIENAFDAELYPAGYETKLTADIDLKDKTFTCPATYQGTFDGDGHSIKNLKSSTPLFRVSNNATFKNLVIDSSCSFEFAYNAEFQHYGTIVGNCDKGNILNCTNKAKITMPVTSTGATFIGGITGRTGSTAVIEGCINQGDVIIKPSTAVAVEYRVGGIVGSGNGTLKNCKNDAAVEYSPADLSGKGFYLGGITGYVTDKPTTGCVNTVKGKVTFNPVAYSGTSECYIAGLCAYINKKTTISDCKNFGDVLVTANHENLFVGGLSGYIYKGETGFVLFDKCAVNCNVTAVTAAAGGTTSTNPLNKAGLVLGYKKGPDGVTCTIGTDADPIKVAGSLTVYGGSTSTATAENYKNYILGNAAPSDLFGGSTKFIIKSAYEAVTKE